MLYKSGPLAVSFSHDASPVLDVDSIPTASTSASSSFHSSTADSSPDSTTNRQSITSPIHRSRLTTTCAICGGVTSCRHFGAPSCNACAAFFRRTIAEKRTYSCSHHGNCTLISELVRRMCRHCRFKKCLQVGMQEAEVLSLGSSGKSTPVVNTPLVKVKKEVLPPPPPSTCTSIARFDHESRYYVKDDVIGRIKNAVDSIIYSKMAASHTILNNTNSESRLPDVCRWILIEAKVLQSFLKSSGLSEYVSKQEIRTNIVQMTGAWATLNMMMNTLKFNGPDNGRMYLIDYHYLTLTEEGVLNWYKSEAEIKDPVIMTKICMPMFHRCLDIVSQLKSMELTPVEVAVYVMLVTMQFLSEFSSNPAESKLAMASFSSQIFKGMKKYYEENFTSEDYGYRFGRIIMVLSPLMESHGLMRDHREYLKLLGKPMIEYTDVVLNKALSESPN